MKGWYWATPIFGGLIGILIVDPATGAMWPLPERNRTSFGATAINQNLDLKLMSLANVPADQKGSLVAPTLTAIPHSYNLTCSKVGLLNHPANPCGPAATITLPHTPRATGVRRSPNSGLRNSLLLKTGVVKSFATTAHAGHQLAMN